MGRRQPPDQGEGRRGIVLLVGHGDLTFTPADASRLMQALGRRYVRTVNHLYRRSGTLWEGRFRACGVRAEEYLLACMRYIELNRVRAGMVASPEAYRWSSFRRNGLGAADTLVAEHALSRASMTDFLPARIARVSGG